MKWCRISSRHVALTALLFAIIALVPIGASSSDNHMKVSLTAVVAPGAQPLMDALFTVSSIDDPARMPLEVKSIEGPAVLKLPAGRYWVRARYGDSGADKEIVVGNGVDRYEVSLNAGSVVLRLKHHVGGPVLRKDVTWEILTYGRDVSGNRHLIASSPEAQPKFYLPEGYYVAQAKNGTRDVRHTIEVTSGANYKYTVILQ